MKKDTEKEVKGWKLPVWNHLKTTSEWLQNSPVIPLSSEIEWFWLLPVQSGWNRGNIPSLSAFCRKGRFFARKHRAVHFSIGREHATETPKGLRCGHGESPKGSRCGHVGNPKGLRCGHGGSPERLRCRHGESLKG